jgi:subtilisin family serine protease
MRRNSIRRRPILGLMLCGLLLTASCIGGSSPVSAQFRMGGFGRMGGGFGRPGVGIVQGPQRQIALPRRGGGRVVELPPGRNRGGTGYRGGRGPGHHRIIGGGIARNPGSQGSGLPIGGGRNTVSRQNAGGGNNGRGGVPPRGERRFVPDEVITEFSPSATPQAIDRVARRYNLTRLESQSFPLTGSTLYRWRIAGRRSVADVVGAIEDERIVAGAQPNYIFTLQEDAAKISSDTQGDPAQYVLGKLQVEQAHQVATGKNVLVAVIDSEIDVNHPNLDGTIVKSFDALGGEAKPHQHGTAIAGAIAAHGKLLGIAPGARLLAARAFDDTPGAANGTSFAIYKALQWAADNGARVVNMSFAGPADPALHRMLTAAYEKDMVLIAAAGNTGPNSAPLYPAADPDVIAVTATDSNDGLFKMANSGGYIAVAAPGVEILALAPGESYQITTGTSVAAAHVSGIAALLLERKPSLMPADIRTIITTSAKPLQLTARHSDFGAGLVNAFRAVMLVNGKSVGKDDDEQAKQ